MSTELAQFLSPGRIVDLGCAGIGSRSRRLLWVVGAKGSGAGTAIQAALAGASSATGTSASSGVSPIANGRPQAPIVAVLDCSTPTAPASASGMNGLYRTLDDMLLLQIAQQVEAATQPSIDLAQVVITAALQRHPEAAAGLVAASEAAGSRMGLPGALPTGTELAGWSEIVVKHGTDPVSLGTAMASLVASVHSRQSLLRPPTALHAALALLRDAGARIEASRRSGLAFATAPLSSLLLLAATEGLVAALGRDAVLVLLRAEALGRESAGSMFLQACSEAALIPVSPGCGCVRLLVQSRDGIAAARSYDAGALVLTMAEWSEDMAKAVVQPRYLEIEDVTGWQAIWAAVGGHAAHLRRAAEFLNQERLAIVREATEGEREKRQVEVNRQLRPQRSPDAEQFAKIAEQQHDEDSVRFDVRGFAAGACERLLRRLPNAMSDEVTEIEAQVTAFARHPQLRLVLDDRGNNRSIVEMVLALRRLCVGSAGVVVPMAGVGAVQDPVQLALLDVGLLVPVWHVDGSSRLVLASRLAGWVLLAWVEAFCAELPLPQRLFCRFWLWRLDGRT